MNNSSLNQVKRVLFVINSLRFGGAEHMLLNILQQIDYTRYDVSIVYFVKDGVYAAEVPQQVKRIRPFTKGTRLTNLWYFILQRLSLLTKWYRQRTLSCIGHYDAIISYLEGFPVQIHSLITERGKTNISFIHTDLKAFPDSLQQLGGKDCCQEAYNKMDRLVFVSQTALDSFKEVFSNITSTLTVLPNFIDIQGVLKNGDDFAVVKKGFTVTAISRLAPVKGIDIIPLIAAAIKAKGLDAHFYIVGDGSERKHIEELIHSNGVSDSVHLVGYQANPYPYLKIADIYLSTSISEGMPLTFCEAMAFGKPIISSKTAGSQYMLDENVGIIVDRAVSSFVDAILSLIHNNEKRQTMGAYAREKSVLYGSEPYMRALYKMIG